MTSPHTVLIGDSRETLKTLQAESVHCVVTSPPFFRLRDYRVLGQIGNEPSVHDYLDSLCAVFSEVSRVLRPDGTLWLELGDTYDGWGGRALQRLKHKSSRTWGAKLIEREKALLGMPWRLAFALADRGWLLRAEIVWHKPNAMPESAQDRPTRAHTTVFLFSRKPRYYYDPDGWREQCAEGSGARTVSDRAKLVEHGDGRANESFYAATAGRVETRNARTVWSIPTAPYHGPHAAAFAPEVPRRAILLGTSERGCCPSCGAPWRRVVRVEGGGKKSSRELGETQRARSFGGPAQSLSHRGHHDSAVRQRITEGWAQDCGCAALEPVPCTVLDPFAGTGTTGMVAGWLGRKSVLCELDEECRPLIAERLKTPRPGVEAEDPRQLRLAM